MGRGRGGADEIFYGEELASSLGVSETEEPDYVDMALLDKMALSLATALATADRDPATLKPSATGERLVDSGRAFALWNGDKLATPRGRWISIRIARKMESGALEIEVVACDPQYTSNVVVGPIIYSGPSSEHALEAARSWARENPVENSFPLSDQEFFDIVQRFWARVQ